LPPLLGNFIFPGVASKPVNGHPGLYDFAATWSENATSGCGSSGRFGYAYGQISQVGVGGGISINNFVSTFGGFNGNSDVACYTDVITGDKLMAITYGGGTSCSGTGLYLWEFDPFTGSTINTHTLDATYAPIITRVEAMSQYDTSYIRWQVVAAMPDPISSAFPYQVYGYNNWNIGSPDYLSFNWGGVDTKSPAVAAGIGPNYSGDIGNTQYTTGYYPQDYNNQGLFPDIFSHAVDATTGAVSIDYQVNTSSVIYPWDVNRAYAVSNSSNSGFDILSAYFNGNDIVYKVSGNTMAYKLGNNNESSEIKVQASLYPNPSKDELHIQGVTGGKYVINDITGKNKADSGSLAEAVKLAKIMVRSRRFSRVDSL